MLNAFTLNGPTVPALATSFRRALVAHVRADAGILAAVSTRVYRGTASKGVDGPALLYQFVALTRERGVRGPTGIARAVVQFTAVRGRGTDGEAVAEAVRRLFDGFRGPVGAYAVVETILGGERDQDDSPPVQGQGEPASRTILEAVFRYREPVVSR